MCENPGFLQICILQAYFGVKHKKRVLLLLAEDYLGFEA